MKTKEMTKLKPCPFCGSKKVYIHTVLSHDAPRRSNIFMKAVVCEKCEAQIHSTIEKYAIKAWNRRPE